MASLLIFTINNDDVEPLVLKRTDTLMELDEYISSNFIDESDLVNSNPYFKSINNFYNKNIKLFDRFEFGYLKILYMRNSNRSLELRYLDPLYDNDKYKKIASRNIFGENSYLKKREKIKDENLVYTKK